MNNEIKEILDAWKNKKYILAYTFNYDSAREQNDKLLDYITNLQQEINKLTAESTKWESKYYEMLDNFHNANKEIERLKQPKIFIDTQDMEERYGEELYKDYLEKQVKDYKSRIEKAVEYIKENAWYMNKDDEEILDRVGIEGLLDILNGDNNEKDKYKSRIEKAVEYLKGNACYIESNIFVDDLCCNECMELLNILEGKDGD